MQGLETLEMDPDPEGDVILSIGPDPESAVRLRVSSKLLSLASPVFATMFSSKFIEGKARSAENPRTVSLPDDYPKAVIWFCRAVHFQMAARVEISLTMFVELAIFCDKYDCSKGLRPWSSLWLAGFSYTAWTGFLRNHYWEQNCDEMMLFISSAYGEYGYEENRYEIMLFASYVYEDLLAFWENSRSLLRLSRRDNNIYHPLRGPGLAAILPEGLLGTINSTAYWRILKSS